MNIFVLSRSAALSAQYHCDKHVPKMIVESVQMLVSAIRANNGLNHELPKTKAGNPMKGGFAHHPCTKWVGAFSENYEWTFRLYEALLDEYELRFEKVHDCARHKTILESWIYKIPGLGKCSPRPTCMPDEYKILVPDQWGKPQPDVVKSYRNYYCFAKPFATWMRGRKQPNWYTASVKVDSY